MTVLKSPDTREGGLPAAVLPAVTEMIDHARPSVVQVRSRGRGSGTGVVWRSDAVITNDHVVAHARGPMDVRLTDGRTFEARVGARSPELDLAVLHVAASDLPVAAVGDSTKLRVGELVFAIGHPWGQPWVVTAGIVSGLGEVPVRGDRTALYIRSDVRLAPGNSGGPLLNASGEVIGINAMVFGGDLAVAIPSHVASSWTNTPPEQGRWLGLGVQAAEVPAGVRRGAWAGRGAGLLVVGVEPDGPAAQAGLLVGDMLLDANGAPLESPAALRDALAQQPAPERLRLYLLRAGGVMPVDVRFERG